LSFVRLRRPSVSRLEAIRAELAAADYSYSPGILSGPVPSGYTTARHRHELGVGPEVWAQARAALTQWAQFDVGWAAIATGDRGPHQGQVVIVHAGLLGVSFLAPCRVIETHDWEDDTAAAFGLVYGTLPGHVAVGEECFEVTFDKATGVVAYQLYAMAAPGRWFTRLGRPLLDRWRARFRRDSGIAMARSVGDPDRG
jgi:uncharacterized protein (UPF0548 family)